MTEAAATPETRERLIAGRAEVLFEEHEGSVHRRTDRLFGALMVCQWVFAIVIAVLVSPYGWEGKVRTVHQHVWAAILLGGLITSLPLALIALHPGKPLTRHVVACAQMLWSALLIHLTGGRIETHFHVFGSLAFVAFYRDWKVLVPATVVVAGDHLVRGIFWPESVYGITSPEWWRFLEHAGWVVFEDIILVLGCLRGVKDMRATAARQAEVEVLSQQVEEEKTRRLDEVLGELKESQEALVRSEKLAAVGQLAASVGHELRNPLAAIRNAATYISRKLGDKANGDPRIPQLLGVMDREITASTKIISDLLDFARERTPMLRPCPLRPLVAEAIEVLNLPANVTIRNDVPEALPIPSLDKDQFRQVVVNLLQNAVEASADGGEVKITADGGVGAPWRIVVSDKGPGIASDVAAKVFQPLFTTKTKGTGLGLAIVSNAVARHDGTIRVESELGQGASFVIELPEGAS